MGFWIVMGVVLLLSYVLWVTADTRAAKRVGDEYEHYVVGADKVVERRLDNGCLVVTRVASEVVSKSGRKALVLAAPARRTVVHELNKNGTFSARGPYCVSWYRGNWSETGRRHLVETMRAPAGSAFTASNRGGGAIPEIALRVVEWDTPKYHAVPPSRYEYRSGVTREPDPQRP